LKLSAKKTNRTTFQTTFPGPPNNPPHQSLRLANFAKPTNRT
jgi:hypothetical protein